MKKIVTGTLFVLLGVFLIFNNIGWVDSTIYHWVISWQSLLIAIGFIGLFDTKQRSKEFSAVLMVIGLLFLLPRIFDVPSVKAFILPAIIIGIGLLFLFRTGKKNKCRDHIFGGKENDDRDYHSFVTVEDGDNPTTLNPKDGYVKREYVFSGSKEKWRYEKIRKIEIEAVFSGVEIDLSQIDFAPDANSIHIKVSAVFGGVTLFIPAEWNVVIQKTGIFGGFQDRRPTNAMPHSNSKTVVLELEAVFGGGEVRYYE